MASPTQWTWIWVNSGSWWWTGRPGVLQSVGFQSRTRLSHWTELMLNHCAVYLKLIYVYVNYMLIKNTYDLLYCWKLLRKINTIYSSFEEYQKSKYPSILKNKCAHWNDNSIYACMPSRFSHVRLFAALWTVARQVSLSIGLSRQEQWSGLPSPSPGDLPHPGIELISLTSPALAGRFFTTVTT